MYKIGDFSKITGLSIKTLRYYDDEGIIQPSSIKESGYRYYDDSNYKVAKRVILLKQLHFSINEIKDVLHNVKDDNDLQEYLIEKRQQIKENMIVEDNYISMINQYLSHISKKEETNHSEISIKDVKEMLVISYRFVGKYNEMGMYTSKLYKLAKNKADGNIITVYHDEEYKVNADLEVCLPIKEKVSHGGASIKVLPSMQILSMKHIGHYDKLGESYKKLLDYAHRHNITLLSPYREVYIKGPGMILKGNPDKYITEIQIPIQKG